MPITKGACLSKKECVIIFNPGSNYLWLEWWWESVQSLNSICLIIYDKFILYQFDIEFLLLGRSSYGKKLFDILLHLLRKVFSYHYFWSSFCKKASAIEDHFTVKVTDKFYNDWAYAITTWW